MGWFESNLENVICFSHRTDVNKCAVVVWCFLPFLLKAYCDLSFVRLAKRPAPGCTLVTPAQKITKPACKPRVPSTVQKVSDAAKKPAERKPALKQKPVSVNRWWRVAVVLFYFYAPLVILFRFYVWVSCSWCQALSLACRTPLPSGRACASTSCSELQCRMSLRPLIQQPPREEWVKWQKRGKSTRYSRYPTRPLHNNTFSCQLTSPSLRLVLIFMHSLLTQCVWAWVLAFRGCYPSPLSSDRVTLRLSASNLFSRALLFNRDASPPSGCRTAAERKSWSWSRKNGKRESRCVDPLQSRRPSAAVSFDLWTLFVFRCSCWKQSKWRDMRKKRWARFSSWALVLSLDSWTV